MEHQAKNVFEFKRPFFKEYSNSNRTWFSKHQFKQRSERWTWDRFLSELSSYDIQHSATWFNTRILSSWMIVMVRLIEKNQEVLVRQIYF